MIPKKKEDIIPELCEILKPEVRTFTHFLRTQNSFKFRSSWIDSMKSRILGKFGFSISTPNKNSAFDWNNSRTFIKGILSSEKSCEKPELLHILSELKISQKVLELFQSKAEPLESSGYWCQH